MLKKVLTKIRNPKRIRGLVGYAKEEGGAILMKATIWFFILLLLSVLGIRVKSKEDRADKIINRYRYAAQGGYQYRGR